MTALLESFGGVVKTSLSGKTTHLLLGFKPGLGKVKAVRGGKHSHVIEVLPSDVLHYIAKGDFDTELVSCKGTIVITEFSDGVDGNALRMSDLDDDTKAKVTGKRPREE
jgi:hypothetical protein